MQCSLKGGVFRGTPLVKDSFHVPFYVAPGHSGETSPLGTGGDGLQDALTAPLCVPGTVLGAFPALFTLGLLPTRQVSAYLSLQVGPREAEKPAQAQGRHWCCRPPSAWLPVTSPHRVCACSFTSKPSRRTSRLTPWQERRLCLLGWTKPQCAGSRRGDLPATGSWTPGPASCGPGTSAPSC